jgi:hypothetical protein
MLASSLCLFSSVCWLHFLSPRPFFDRMLRRLIGVRKLLHLLGMAGAYPYSAKTGHGSMPRASLFPVLSRTI